GLLEQLAEVDPLDVGAVDAADFGGDGLDAARLQEPRDSPRRADAGVTHELRQVRAQPLPPFGLVGTLRAVDVVAPLELAAALANLDRVAAEPRAVRDLEVAAARHLLDVGVVVGELELTGIADLQLLAVVRPDPVAGRVVDSVADALRHRSRRGGCRRRGRSGRFDEGAERGRYRRGRGRGWENGHDRRHGFGRHLRRRAIERVRR